MNEKGVADHGGLAVLCHAQVSECQNVLIVQKKRTFRKKDEEPGSLPH
jgi:hypothetical protein